MINGPITHNQSIVASTINIGVASIDVLGTWTGTLVFECTIDSVNWIAVPVSLLPTQNATVYSTTTNGQWTVSVAGYSKFRVRGNTITSGTAQVYLYTSTATAPSTSTINVSGGGSGESDVQVIHNEVASVASGVETTLITVTAIAPTRIQKVEVSGENVSLYRLKVDGSTIYNKRSGWTDLNQTFEFDGTLLLNVNQVLTVTTFHTRPTLCKFEATVLTE